MPDSKLRRVVFAVLNGISLLCVFAICLLFCSKLHGNRVAAELMAQGFPDLRGDHMIVFYTRLLIASGIGLFCHGLSFVFRPPKKQ